MEDLAAEVSLIEYPSLFPIKVMGRQVDGFAEAMADIARQFDPAFDAADMTTRPSRNGHYLAITLTIHATSREQLDGLYRALSGHPLVKMVL